MTSLLLITLSLLIWMTNPKFASVISNEQLLPKPETGTFDDNIYIVGDIHSPQQITLFNVASGAFIDIGHYQLPIDINEYHDIYKDAYDGQSTALFMISPMTWDSSQPDYIAVRQLTAIDHNLNIDLTIPHLIVFGKNNDQYHSNSVLLLHLSDDDHQWLEDARKTHVNIEENVRNDDHEDPDDIQQSNVPYIGERSNNTDNISWSIRKPANIVMNDVIYSFGGVNGQYVDVWDSPSSIGGSSNGCGLDPTHTLIIDGKRYDSYDLMMLLFGIGVSIVCRVLFKNYQKRKYNEKAFVFVESIMNINFNVFG